MQPAELERVKAIFSEALEKTAAEREDFLDRACGANSALRAEVAAFVHAAESAGEFLSLPARDPAVAVAGIAAGRLSEGPGTTIGRYKLLENIGEGGFGTVFMAEQEFPVRRKVALKIIKLGMDTQQVVARFEAERQALAMMDHPNIAKVLDGGSTETGRPYFVMELVKGDPITSYCKDNELSTRERLDLFIAVCGAVQHAHQKGIIHRDLKPSNVLVTMRDDKAAPMVIDFGIAKATQSRLTEKTLFTEFKQMIGTPTYMSPEQAQLNTLDVDTRSDIYSLGVLLYELLTGSTPFQAKELLSLAYGEMQRVIREVEPPKPSTRLSASTAPDGRRSGDATRLSKIVKGDLDWIVMKCLEKDRTQRYETANDLSKDIQRYLADQPVEASPPSSTYRARRFIRRYRRGLGMAAAVAALLMATTAFSVWEAVNARRAKATALAAAQSAKIEAAKSRQVASFLEDILGGQNPVIAHGRDTTILREILERTLTRIDRELADQPEVRAELYSTIARTYHLAELPGFLEMQRKALQLQRSVFNGDNLAVALSEYRLASMLQPRPESLPLAEESLGMRQRISGDSPATADSLSLVGSISRNLGQLPKAEAVLRQGVAMRKRLGDQNSVQYAINLDELGVALWLQGQRAEGLTLTRQAVDLERKIMPNAVQYALRDLTFELHAGGDLREAQATATELLEIQTKNFPDTGWSRMDCNRILAKIDNDLGEYASAERLSRQNLKLDPRYPGSMIPLAQILFNVQKYSEAETLYRDGLATNRSVLPPDDAAIAWNLANLANLLSAEKKYDEVTPMLHEALKLFRKLSPPNSYDVAWTMTCLANSLSDQGKPSEADPYFRDALQLFRACTAAANPAREWSTTCFANSLLHDGDYVRSEPLFREALAAEIEKQQEHTSQAQATAQGLANLLARTGRAAEAAQLCKDFGFSDPATQPATRTSLSAAPTPGPNGFD